MASSIKLKARIQGVISKRRVGNRRLQPRGNVFLVRAHSQPRLTMQDNLNYSKKGGSVVWSGFPVSNDGFLLRKWRNSGWLVVSRQGGPGSLDPLDPPHQSHQLEEGSIRQTNTKPHPGFASQFRSYFFMGPWSPVQGHL